MKKFFFFFWNYEKVVPTKIILVWYFFYNYFWKKNWKKKISTIQKEKVYEKVFFFFLKLWKSCTYQNNQNTDTDYWPCSKFCTSVSFISYSFWILSSWHHLFLPFKTRIELSLSLSTFDSQEDHLTLRTKRGKLLWSPSKYFLYATKPTIHQA